MLFTTVLVAFCSHLATVGAGGQLFHIMTNSSKEPLRAVVASRPLNRALSNWFRTC